MAVTTSRQDPGMKIYVAVWIGLMLIVAAQVALAYARLPAGTLFALLLALACIEAGIGLLYFMRLKYERAILFWSFIPGLVVALLLMDHIWPDAFRLMHQRLGAP